jgi:hypothetical protein
MSPVNHVKNIFSGAQICALERGFLPVGETWGCLDAGPGGRISGDSPFSTEK